MPFVVGKRVAPPDGTTVRFVVTGVLGRQVTVAVDGRPGRGSGRPWSGAADADLTIDQETFWRSASAGSTPARALAAGQARVDGDLALGHRVLGSMAFMA